MLLKVSCVIYLSVLVGIHSDIYNNKWVPTPLILVKVVGNGRTSTRKVNVLNPLISPVDLPEVLVVVGAVDMVPPHLGRKENCLLMSK